MNVSSISNTSGASLRSPDSAGRLAALRRELAARQVDGFLVPRGDEHQGEYVPPSAERLAWLTGFKGSAGLACVLTETAAIFVDDKASKAQEDALMKVYTGQAGGPVADLAKLIGTVVSVERAPIRFDVQGGKGTIEIGADYYAENPDAHVHGDPRDEWTCGGTS